MQLQWSWIQHAPGRRPAEPQSEAWGRARPAQGDSGGMAKSSVGRLQNLSVSVQRRWNNVLSDATRQVQPRRRPAPGGRPGGSVARGAVAGGSARGLGQRRFWLSCTGSACAGRQQGRVS